MLAILDASRATWWHYREWGFEALLALGRPAEALQYAETSRGINDGSVVDAACERVLLAQGLEEEAYRRYGMSAAPHGATNLGTFRAVRKKYPSIDARRILADLAGQTPGREGRWFAAAVSAGFYHVALALAAKSPADPGTLTRAARSRLADDPRFALEAAFLALRSIAEGWGYEIGSLEVIRAFEIASNAAARLGCEQEFEERLHVPGIERNASVCEALRLTRR